MVMAGNIGVVNKRGAMPTLLNVTNGFDTQPMGSKKSKTPAGYDAILSLIGHKRVNLARQLTLFSPV
jgi:hypothetical protein